MAQIYIYIYMDGWAGRWTDGHTHTHTNTNCYCFTLEVTEHFIHKLSACVETGICDVHLPYFNVPAVYLLLNTNNLLYVYTVFTQYTINTISNVTPTTLLPDLSCSK
jgi:hypothetical protein